MLRFFPPVVTGTIILVIGISLMRIGINWIFGLPLGPTAPKIVNPEHAAWLQSVTALGEAVPAAPKGLALAPTVDNPAYAPVSNILLSLVVLGIVIAMARFAKGFLSNIAVLIGIIAGGVIAAALGMMHFDKVAVRGLVRADHAVPLRHADLPAGLDRHHDAGDDRLADRVRPACSWR